MGFQNYLSNRKGQILIETLVLCTVMSGLLLIFMKLIHYQKKHRQTFYFSQTVNSVNENR